MAFKPAVGKKQRRASYPRKRKQRGSIKKLAKKRKRVRTTKPSKVKSKPYEKKIMRTENVKKSPSCEKIMTARKVRVKVSPEIVTSVRKVRVKVSPEIVTSARKVRVKVSPEIVITREALPERLQTNHILSELPENNVPDTPSLPEWLQTELNESTSVEPISVQPSGVEPTNVGPTMNCAVTPIRSPTSQQSDYYYEIQDVFCAWEGETPLIHLRDVGLFGNFEAARDSFIKNTLEKIKNGCKPVRTNGFSYQWLYDALEASRNSIYGYWLRVTDPDLGLIETFLRKKKRCLVVI